MVSNHHNYLKLTVTTVGSNIIHYYDSPLHLTLLFRPGYEMVLYYA